MNKLTEEALLALFTYHPPTDAQKVRYEKLRRAALDFVKVLVEVTPVCADQSAAIRHIRDAVMTGNAAIALDGIPLGGGK